MREKSVKERTNQIYVISCTFLTAVYSLGIAMMLRQGSINFKAGVAALIIMVTTSIGADIFHFKNRESKFTSHISAIFFATVYVIVLFSSKVEVAPMLIIPMLIIASCYLETKFLLIQVSGSFLLNVIWIVLNKSNFKDTSSILMQVVIIILSYGFLISITRFSQAIRKQA